MREIKFRVFIKPLDSMIRAHKLTFASSGDALIWVNDTFYFNGHEAHLMQYTGLEDMRYKEIYEGDIVIVHHSDGDLTGIIKFGRGMFYIDCLPQEDHLFSNCIFTFDMIDTMDIEVIGNTYENPELLEVSKND